MKRGSSHWHIVRRIVRTTAGLALIPLIAWSFVCMLVLLQGNRDEARRVDAIVVLYPSVSTRSYLEYGVELYRQGYSTRLLLAGEDAAEVQETLSNRGIPDAALLPLEEAHGRYTRLAGVAALMHREGLNSVLLVNRPEHLLLDLKMARDLGLTAYGSPVASEDFKPGDVFRAGLAYWQYVLLGTSG